MDSHRGAAVLIAFLGLIGCEDGAGEPSTAQLAAREDARRQACAAREALATAEDEVATIEAAVEGIDPANPGALPYQATLSVLEYSRAYSRHAELRRSVFAHLDSAVNHAPTDADSTRFAERAASFTIRPPQLGTIEANVVEDYQNDLIAILDDDDHRCNWDPSF